MTGDTLTFQVQHKQTLDGNQVYFKHLKSPTA